MSRICTECDCSIMKRKRGRQDPLHQYIVGVPMERLAMDVAGPYPITSTGNQYCLMVGCYFSKWLECFPIPEKKAMLGSWYMGSWHAMEHCGSCIAIRAQITGQRWYWRCVGCSEYTRRGLPHTTRGVMRLYNEVSGHWAGA